MPAPPSLVMEKLYFAMQNYGTFKRKVLNVVAYFHSRPLLSLDPCALSSVLVF